MASQLPVNWVETTLGEIRIDRSIGISQAEMRGEEFELYSVPAYTERNPETARGDSIGSNKILVHPGDVLLCKINPRINRAWIVGNPQSRRQIASTEWIVFSQQDGLSPSFLRYFFTRDEFRDYLARNVSGVGGSLMRVRPSIVEAYPFPLPPTNEQIRITSKLDSAFSRVAAGEAAAERARTRLDRYRARVLNAAVVGELTADWRKKHRQDRNTDNGKAVLNKILGIRREHWEKMTLAHLTAAGKGMKDEKWKSRYPEPVQPDLSDMPELPGGWVWASLEMVAEIGSGISVSRSRVVDDPIELPYLRVANVLRGHLDLTEIKTIRIEKTQLTQYLLRPGDVLFNEGGDRDKLGRGWVWEGQIPQCIHQNHVFRARLFERSLLDPRLVSHWGNTFGQQFFTTHGTQTTNLASINRSVLGKLPIPIPPVAEQAAIIAALDQRLTAAARLADSLKEHLSRAQRTRFLLLQDAFSGRLVPQDSRDESATILLRRLQAAQKLASQESTPKRMSKSIPANSIQGLRPLLDVLRSQKEPMAPEQLFRDSGYQQHFEANECRQEIVDRFYEELRKLTSPDGPVREKRPDSKTVLLEVRP